MTVLELDQVHRDLNFESENRVNLISVISCSREVVGTYIVRTDVQSVGIYARNEHCSQTHINVGLGLRSQWVDATPA